MMDTPNDDDNSGDHEGIAKPSSLAQGSRPTFEASLPACFGYFEGSKSNLLGLMQGVNNNSPTLFRGSLY